MQAESRARSICTHSIHDLEMTAARAVGSEGAEEVDGWFVRHDSRSPARRRNSVLALQDRGSLTLGEKLTLVEDVYGTCNLPTRFQVSPASVPRHLDDVLATRGYEYEAPTWVMVGDLEAVAEHEIDANIQIRDQPDLDWIALAERLSNSYSSELSRRAPQGFQYGFVSLERGGRLAGISLGIVEGPWMGIFSMGTSEGLRRSGVAESVLAGLAHWGVEHGATRAYLQVEFSNWPAQGLYFKNGFDRVYSYHYRTKYLP